MEVDWQAASTPGANNGSLDFWLNEVQQSHITGIDNDTWQIARVLLGALGTISSSTYGTLYFDGFESRRRTYIAPADPIFADGFEFLSDLEVNVNQPR